MFVGRGQGRKRLHALREFARLSEISQDFVYVFLKTKIQKSGKKTLESVSENDFEDVTGCR